MRRWVAVVMLCAVQMLSAQIHIIPHDKLLEAAEPKKANSSLRPMADKVDFGTIDEMAGVWLGRATLVNDGVDTIVITRLRSTCGCLRAEVSKNILAPKEKVAVFLKYYPRGHAGRVLQRVFVYTDISNEHPSAIVRLEGVVTASTDRRDDYPYTRGVLRLRQERVRFDGLGREVVRVAIMNGGSSILQPTADANFLPKGLRVRFEPAVLIPKQEGDMVIEYTPTVNESEIRHFRIYLKGLNVPPRQSAIEVVVENKK